MNEQDFGYSKQRGQGCTNKSCFCTGRCRMTPEEERAHQEFETEQGKQRYQETPPNA